MTYSVLPSLVLATFIHQTMCLSHTDLVWIKTSTSPESYSNVPTANILRCSKMCERQDKCGAVSFDGTKRMCYLHDSRVTSPSSDSNGKYMFRKIQKNTPGSASNTQCGDDDIRVPTLGNEGGTCVAPESEQPATLPMTTDETPVRSTEANTTTVTTKAEESSTARSTKAETTTVTTNAVETTTVNPCKNNQTFNGSACNCEPSLTGQYCENGPRDCADPFIWLGWTYVYPDDGIGKIRVLCHFGFLVAFAAPKGGFTAAYHNRTWDTYKTGFGSIEEDVLSGVNGSYWLGNDNIYRLTKSQTYSYKLSYAMAIEQRTSLSMGNYLNFVLGDEDQNYTLNYQGYESTEGLEKTLQSGHPFRANDRNDDGCAAIRHVGFWFGGTCSPNAPLFGFIKINGDNVNYTYFYGFIIRM